MRCLILLGPLMLVSGATAADTEALETIPPGEASAIQTIVSTIQQIQKALYGAGQRPALRDAHAKAHGCVEATFRVRANLAARLRQGVFREPKTYSAWIRFSNGNGTPRDDHSGDGRGMAIKLMDVEGTKIPAGGEQERTQDFVMINYPVFFVRNAADYVEFTNLSGGNKANQFFASHRHEAEISAAITAKKIHGVFDERYFSMTPYLLGTRAMKFSAIPVQCASGSPIKASSAQIPAGGPTYLRDGMSDWLKEKDACFHFAVQFQRDPKTMPIEDPTILWDEKQAPFEMVADIRIGRQIFDTPERNSFCENLSYTPWHALPEHRPLGGINRVRRSVYEEISKLRHGLNHSPRVEPSSQTR